MEVDDFELREQLKTSKQLVNLKIIDKFRSQTCGRTSTVSTIYKANSA